MKARRQLQPDAWIVDDNAKSRADVSDVVRRVRLSPVQLATQSELVDRLTRVSDGERVPAIIVLDLRLPWLAARESNATAISGGLECLALLRQEPSTAQVPVVIYSAFVRDDVINNELRVHQPISLVDKRDGLPQLRVVLENILPQTATLTRRDRLSRWFATNERLLIRVGSLAAAGTAIWAAVAWIFR